MQEILEALSLVKIFRLNNKQQRLTHNSHKTKTALDGLSFSVRNGEIFGLLGPNGAGKTTAMRIAAGLIKSDHGDVFIDGFSVRKQIPEVQKRIGFLSEDLRFDDFFTPSYLFDFFSTLRGLSKERTRERKELLFDQFEINEFAQERIATLSNGMKQKVSLVLSIAHEPEIIIFDEPTNGLDIVAARMVVDFLLELKKQGNTIIISTHIFSLVEKICDRVGIIIEGKMVFCDSLSRITEKTTIEDVFFSLFKELHGYKESGVSPCETGS